MKKKSVVLIILIILFAIAAPYLFSHFYWGVDFTETGQIGDTIGGITAPIIGILSVLLLFYTLWEQRRFNEKQKEISSDEQFKSTFFNLLQVQRDILEKVSGKFTYLGRLVYEEYPKQDNEITIKKDDKVFATIENKQNNSNEEVRSLDFFKSAKYQLRLIYNALDCKTFCRHYDREQAYDAENDLRNSIITGCNIPPEIEIEQDELIDKTRKPFKFSYINDKYGISKEMHDKYQSSSINIKIGLGYAYFFYKYEEVGYYFRHLYNILKFIKKNEDEKIQALGKKPKQSQIDAIKKDYKEYASFLQAQMSIDELLLLFYNCFAFKKAQRLIIYYGLLENLTIQNLINAKHNCMQELNLKSKNDIFTELINRNL